MKALRHVSCFLNEVNIQAEWKLITFMHWQLAPHYTEVIILISLIHLCLMGDALALTRSVCVSVIRWLGGSLPEAEAGDEWLPEDQAARRAREKQQNISQQHLLRCIFIPWTPHTCLFVHIALRQQLNSSNMLCVKLRLFFFLRPRASEPIWAKYGWPHITPPSLSSPSNQSIKSELQTRFYQNAVRAQQRENPCCESVIRKIYIMVPLMPGLNEGISSPPHRASVSSLLVCRSSLPSVGTSSKWDRQS